MLIRPRQSRKILVASIGVATMSYVIACGGTETGSGGDSGGDGAAADRTVTDAPVGNLAAPDVNSDRAADTFDDTPVANLVALPDASHDTMDEFPVANLVAVPDSGDAH
jgi:hypothetical protein